MRPVALEAAAARYPADHALAGHDRGIPHYTYGNHLFFEKPSATV
jgi:hypothetical protein